MSNVDSGVPLRGSNNVERYKHTQIGYVIIAGLGAGILIVLSNLFTQSLNWVVIFFIMLIGAVLFAALTIEVADGVLKVSFGPGIIRSRSVSLISKLVEWLKILAVLRMGSTLDSTRLALQCIRNERC